MYRFDDKLVYVFLMEHTMYILYIEIHTRFDEYAAYKY